MSHHNITNSRQRLLTATISLALGISSSAYAVGVSFTGTAYTQNFDSLPNSGTWANNSTLSGWFLFSQPAPGTALTSYLVGNGSNNTGSFYSFGTPSATDRALGGVGSGTSGGYFGSSAAGSVAGWIAFAATNVTGSTINQLSLSFDGEQWRDGGNANLASQQMVLQYGFGATFETVSSWSAPCEFHDAHSDVVQI